MINTKTNNNPSAERTSAEPSKEQSLSDNPLASAVFYATAGEIPVDDFRNVVPNEKQEQATSNSDQGRHNSHEQSVETLASRVFDGLHYSLTREGNVYRMSVQLPEDRRGELEGHLVQPLLQFKYTGFLDTVAENNELALRQFENILLRTAPGAEEPMIKIVDGVAHLNRDSRRFKDFDNIAIVDESTMRDLRTPEQEILLKLSKDMEKEMEKAKEEANIKEKAPASHHPDKYSWREFAIDLLDVITRPVDYIVDRAEDAMKFYLSKK